MSGRKAVHEEYLKAGDEVVRLKAVNERLLKATRGLQDDVEALQQQRAELIQKIAQHQAEIGLLRGFLKYLKGEAQDRDDLKQMDEIDDALVKSVSQT